MTKKAMCNMTSIQNWINDLRSGKYTQTTGVLCQFDTDNNKQHCCLGVAVETLGGFFYPVDEDLVVYDEMYDFYYNAVGNTFGLSNDDDPEGLLEKFDEFKDWGVNRLYVFRAECVH